MLAHNTAVGHTVVLMIQTLTDPGMQTDTVTSVSSPMGTFQFVNSYNDIADYEIWVTSPSKGSGRDLMIGLLEQEEETSPPNTSYRWRRSDSPAGSGGAIGPEPPRSLVQDGLRARSE